MGRLLNAGGFVFLFLLPNDTVQTTKVNLFSNKSLCLEDIGRRD